MRVFYCCVAVLSLCVMGCGGTNDGPQRYHISGVVNFEGKPIPVGMIYFIPDSTKGNNGPGSGAEIKNGQYSTPPAGGIVGGPMIVKIDGYDGISQNISGEVIPNGTALFPTYEVVAEFDKKTGQKNFEVTKAEAAKVKGVTSTGFTY